VSEPEDPAELEDKPTEPPKGPEETHPPVAADREGAVTLRAEEEEEAHEDDEDVIVIAAEQALQDDGDIDLDHLLDEDEKQAEFWVEVEDLGDEDIALLDVATPEAGERWTPVDDTDESDVDVADGDGEAIDDPWGPTVDAAEPETERMPAPPPPPNLSVPVDTTRPVPRRPLVPRVLPWRSLVTPLAPEMGRTLLTTDPTRDRSALLVSTWSWLETSDEPLLHFRLADDAAAVTARSEAPDQPLVRCTLTLGSGPVEVALDVETARDGVGIVLGRDVLAGRFLVDPGKEELDPD